MEFRLLGPLEVVHQGAPLAFGPRARRLLAVLLVHANQHVAVAELIQTVWADIERRPPNPKQRLHQLFHRLRKHPPAGLGAGPITSGPGGYMLTVRPGQRDIDHWQREVDHAQAAGDAGDWAAAWGHYATALALWRGPALADFAGEPFARQQVARLEAQRLTMTEAQLRVGLRLGRYDELIGELQALLAVHPLRESSWALLMLAHYHSGQQVEALSAYQTARANLVEQLGVEPGPLLQRLQRGVLVQHAPGELERLLLADTTPTPAASAVQPTDVAERDGKLLTVLAARLVARPGGITVVDPEAASDHMAQASQTAHRIIRRYGGEVVSGEVPGRLVAVFGIPQSHEDDPERAVRAALEIRTECQRSRLAPSGGIATGDAVVTITAGPDGQPGHVHVDGAVVHTAISLEAMAPPGQVLVGSCTRDATVGVDYEPYAEPPDRHWWRVRGLRGRTGAQVVPPQSPLLERDRELAVLASMLQRSVRDAHPQQLTLISEPGLGKSRLIAELAHRADAAPELVAWRCGRCLPYGQGRWGALADILAAHLGILEDDPAEVIDAKLHQAVAEVITAPADAAATVHALQLLLHAGGPQQPEPSSDLIERWQQFLAATTRPLVLVVEDVHWADTALLAFLEGLIGRAGAVPLLVATTARPELLDRQPGWGGGGRDRVALSLTPLSPSATEELLTALTADIPLDDATRRALLAASGGNPLYVHEYVRMLRDQRASTTTGNRRTLTMPKTVQQVIAARADTLAAPDRRLLQAAAVLGQTSWAGALAAVSGLDRAQVHAGLVRLERRELLARLRVSSVAGETEYAFCHALVREVVYLQMLRTAQAALHRRAATWFSQLGDCRQHAERVTYHQQQAATRRAS